MGYVIYNEKKFEVNKNFLFLVGKRITNITEIKGLEKLINLKELYIGRNLISETPKM